MDNDSPVKWLKIGDWVYSFRQGIWQVYRILANFYELRYSLTEPKKMSNRILVFSKRLIPPPKKNPLVKIRVSLTI
jgi:hypothetical protein